MRKSVLSILLLLVAALPRPPQVLELPDAGHNSVQEFPAYRQALETFFR